METRLHGNVLIMGRVTRMKGILMGGILAALLLLVACGGQADQDGVADTGSNWPKGITIGAAPTGGTFHVYATAWADIIINQMEVSANVEATSGPTANIQLIEKGEVDVGLVTM